MSTNELTPEQLLAMPDAELGRLLKALHLLGFQFNILANVAQYHNDVWKEIADSFNKLEKAKKEWEELTKKETLDIF